MNVINFGRCRDLMARWNEVRKAVLAGTVKGFSITLLHRDGSEAVFLGGEYEDDPEAAVRVAMRMSWELTKEVDAKLAP